ncbi:short-chain fatty acyl-CoA regulator family protein [Pseudopelagicola sp. nBUS_19]|uniref:short-chain fatty acyl-CoA regulator family protein n=1 Tax=unclassified Pseudopelagicola TaxID=2649563 RepID=UPI003EB887AE
MSRDTLTGSRIRERRVMQGMRQAELAKEVGISASYLNLIEHNRRRIGGKLLVNIAQVLNVETSLLSKGAEAALIASLREAAAITEMGHQELQQIDEFAGRFPGWAALVEQQYHRLESLERTAVTLADRLTHDPHLAASVHEMLTMVTAIRSTAGILAETKELEPEWRNRFQRNLNEDSQRLADSSQQLVAYLDGAADAAADLTLPREEVDTFLTSHKFRFQTLDQATPDAVRKFVAVQSELTTAAARDLAKQALLQIASDSRAMPESEVRTFVLETGIDPVAVARFFGTPLSSAIRRLAILSDVSLPVPMGLVMCDGSGTLMLRKQVEGFPLPRFSAACPKWPLFQALSHPMRPISQLVTVTGRDSRRFRCFAVAEPVGALELNVDPLYHSYMLIVPIERGGDSREVGSTCRICSSQNCEGRREPSLLAEGN